MYSVFRSDGELTSAISLIQTLCFGASLLLGKQIYYKYWGKQPPVTIFANNESDEVLFHLCMQLVDETEKKQRLPMQNWHLLYNEMKY